MTADFEVRQVDAERAELAVDALRHFGKGVHPAGLTKRCRGLQPVGAHPVDRSMRLADELDEIAKRCAALPVRDARTPDEILSGDEHGLPR